METDRASRVLIRSARKSDIPRVIEMGRRFYRESGYEKHLAENPDQMRCLAEQVMAANGLLVSECGGELTGMFGYVLFPHFISGELIAGEVFWWMEPESRGEGLNLLRVAEDKARSAGAKRMQMIAPNKQVARVYERLKYEFVEMAYQKTI